VTVLAQLLGFLLLVAGVALWSPAAAMVVAGAMLLVAGALAERAGRPGAA
jgi:hypothetical protein